MSECSTMDMVLQRLLKYRHGLGLSQMDFSKCIGSSQTNYSDVERGNNIMSYRLLSGLYKYDYDIDYFFTGKHTVVEDSLLEKILRSCSESEAARLYNLIITGFMELWGEDDNLVWNKCLFSELRAMSLLIMQKGDMDARLHYIRMFHGLSQKDLGNVMGVGRTKCGECEYGKKNIDADMLLRLYNCGYAFPSFFFEDLVGIRSISFLLERDVDRKRRFYRYLENVLLYIMENDSLLQIIRTSEVL
ncbi:MAG: transcriptional regulator [Lachnospiraceae bacterium]|nr:transcriptional regulator [Lachnospiraceae bacterium]